MTVLSWAAAVARREETRRAQMAASAHPALRWAADGHAHRRIGAVLRCGAPGGTDLAAPGAPLCPACYPRDPA
jgi:hypothetical protein